MINLCIICTLVILGLCFWHFTYLVKLGVIKPEDDMAIYGHALMSVLIAGLCPTLFVAFGLIQLSF